MSTLPTKSSGIRMSTELYNWIDNQAALRKTTRSQCVSNLIRFARSEFNAKPKAIQPVVADASMLGMFFSSAIIVVGLLFLFHLL